MSSQDLKAQINFYNFFSTFFREKPSNDWLKSALEFVGSWDESSSPLHQQFLENIQKYGLDNYITILTQEYERLFFAPGHILVNLYESVYCGSGLLMQETTVNVRQHYLRTGLVVKSLYSIPDDHIATELEFMQFLSQKLFELVQQDGSAEDIKEIMVWQSEFISEHLQQWIPTLAETIRANSTEPFFRLMSIGLESLVE
jgi:TorA maturation chaperone TorD